MANKYIPINVNLTNKQLESIKNSTNFPITLKISPSNLTHGPHKIYLTKKQFESINPSKTTTISMSKTQTIYNTKNGGFLSALLSMAAPLILKALPFLAKGAAAATLGAVSGASSYGVQKALKGKGVPGNDFFGEGYKRKTGGVMGDRFYGSCVDPKIYIVKTKKGEGLILGPNSPFKNIPIVGAIL